MPFVLRAPGESLISPHATETITEWVPGRFRKKPPNGFLKWPRLRVRVACGVVFLIAIYVAAKGTPGNSSPTKTPSSPPPSIATTYTAP